MWFHDTDTPFQIKVQKHQPRANSGEKKVVLRTNIWSISAHVFISTLNHGKILLLGPKTEEKAKIKLFETTLKFVSMILELKGFKIFKTGPLSI